ncbi:MAG: TetR/AcrR family transcriptional regulator [Magnetococcales bacterium]|nr:TetR/AcrR family transcriptional regulator [Magnetococcales bacterium]
MARRTDHSRDDLFDLILDEAEKIIETKGVSALTARSIATAIGYSPGTLYNLFANIDEIILRLNCRTMDDLYQKLSDALKKTSGRTKLDKMISTYLDYNKASTQRWDLLFEHRLAEGQELPDWYQKRLDLLIGLLVNALRSMLPECGEKEVNHSARVLWCSLYGICSLAKANNLTGTKSKAVDEMARSLIYNYISGLRRAG